MRVLELYSGIGGMHYALQESRIEAKVVAAVDINTVANEVYKHNIPSVLLINRNIQSISLNEINDLNIDTILMSPPCQPFTRIGLQKDISDSRSQSLFRVLELIPQIKTLEYILLENVKGFENSEMRNAVLKCLNESGFHYKELIVSPCEFGIPNTRYRYYLLAKKKHLKFCFDEVPSSFTLPDKARKLLPKSKHNILVEKNINDLETGKNCYALDNILENGEEYLKEYLIPNKLLLKRSKLMDVRTPRSRGSCCFTKAYARYVEGTGSVFCPHSEELVKEKFCEAGKCSQQSFEVSEILGELGLRYFTPREVCRLMCFPEDFTFPKQITRKQKYRLLGNSINVHVVSNLIYLLFTENEIV